MRLAVAFVVLIASRVASAEPPETLGARLGWFGEVSGWIGTMSTTYKDIPPLSIRPTLYNLRAAVGGTLPLTPELELRIGAVIDGFTAESGGTAFGIATDLGWTLSGQWKLGPRFSLSKGFGGAAPETGSGIVLVGGVRLRAKDITIGVDAIHVTNEHADGTGILVGGGLDGRSGKVGVVVTAAGATLFGIGFFLLVTAIARKPGN